MGFALTFPEIAVAAPVVVLLAASDELSLSWLHADAVTAGLRVASFQEPDLGGALTAVALERSGWLTHLRWQRGGEKMTTATTDLRAELVELTAERDALRAQLAGDLPQATRWLQRKVWRQAAELDRLNRRVTSQRFVLRTLAELGRSLTAEEHRAARDAVTNVELRDRIAIDAG